MKVVIIGTGLAGLSCFYLLKQNVSDIKFFEHKDTIASQASGNSTGTVNPRFSAHKTPQSDFYSHAFKEAIQFFDSHSDQFGWNKCGALHLMNNEKKEKRFPQTVQNWGWEEEGLKLVSSKEASEIANVDLEHSALYLRDSGYLNPKHLCDFYAQGATIEFNTSIESLSDIDADIIILACGQGMRGFEETKDLPIGHVRGQITHTKASSLSSALQCNLHYGGYFTPAIDGVHTLGATFQRWLDHSDIMPEDDRKNIKSLAEVSQKLADDLEIVGQRASVRTTSHDHFPIVGRLPRYENVFVSTAHGSHGIVSSFGAAQLITDIIFGRPPTLLQDTIEALDPARFL